MSKCTRRSQARWSIDARAAGGTSASEGARSAAAASASSSLAPRGKGCHDQWRAYGAPAAIHARSTATSSGDSAW